MNKIALIKTIITILFFIFIPYYIGIGLRFFMNLGDRGDVFLLWFWGFISTVLIFALLFLVFMLIKTIYESYEYNSSIEDEPKKEKVPEINKKEGYKIDYPNLIK